MKTLLLFLSAALLTAPAAQAACHSVFVGGFGSIMIANHQNGPPDQDATQLWDAMDIPEQPSNLGPGKPLVSPGKEINFICVNRGGNGQQMTCTITFNPRGPQSSRWIRLDPQGKKARFLVHGEEAAFFTDKWHRTQGEFRFRSEDGKFSLLVQADRFEIQYAEDGL